MISSDDTKLAEFALGLLDQDTRETENRVRSCPVLFQRENRVTGKQEKKKWLEQFLVSGTADLQYQKRFGRRRLYYKGPGSIYSDSRTQIGSSPCTASCAGDSSRCFLGLPRGFGSRRWPVIASTFA